MDNIQTHQKELCNKLWSMAMLCVATWKPMSLKTTFWE